MSGTTCVVVPSPQGVAPDTLVLSPWVVWACHCPFYFLMVTSCLFTPGPHSLTSPFPSLAWFSQGGFLLHLSMTLSSYLFLLLSHISLCIWEEGKRAELGKCLTDWDGTPEALGLRLQLSGLGRPPLGED